MMIFRQVGFSSFRFIDLFINYNPMELSLIINWTDILCIKQIIKHIHRNLEA